MPRSRVVVPPYDVERFTYSERERPPYAERDFIPYPEREHIAYSERDHVGYSERDHVAYTEREHIAYSERDHAAYAERDHPPSFYSNDCVSRSSSRSVGSSWKNEGAEKEPWRMRSGNPDKAKKRGAKKVRDHNAEETPELPSLAMIHKEIEDNRGDLLRMATNQAGCR